MYIIAEYYKSKYFSCPLLQKQSRKHGIALAFSIAASQNLSGVSKQNRKKMCMNSLNALGKILLSRCQHKKEQQVKRLFVICGKKIYIDACDLRLIRYINQKKI